MLEKLARQTAVYGVSTIVVRFLSYLLTPYYTRIFGQEAYGIVTDVYALIPLALTLLTMGMESSYFRFAAKADEAGGDAAAAKRRLFATTWGVTSLAALLFFGAVALFRGTLSGWMGAAYAEHPSYVVWVGAIVLFDVWGCIPFSRLREQGRSMTFVGFKALNVVLNVVLAFGFGAAGLFASDFGVGWVFVANLAASVVLGLALRALLRRNDTPTGVLHRRLFDWGLFWLVLGLCLEAFEGGIKKDHATLSYFFVTSGLASCVLIAANTAMRQWGVRFGALVKCGRNPMVAYTAAGFLLMPLLTLTHTAPWLQRLAELSPWMGVVRGALVTAAVMGITVLFTNKRLFWRT